MAKYSKPPSKPVVFPQINQIYRQTQSPRGTGGDATRIYSGQGVAPLPSTPKTVTPQPKKSK